MKLQITLYTLFFASLLNAQMAINVNVDNLIIADNNVLFDIVISKHDPSSPDIYLANADFILQFDATAFSNPTFAKVGPAPGFCDLQPEILGTNGINTFITQNQYFTNSSTVIEENRLIVNLNGPTPDEVSIHTMVATIDTAQHRLGRFMITGLSNLSQIPALNCISSGAVQTKVFNFATDAPFDSAPTLIMPSGATCQETVSINNAQIPTANYRADVQLSISGSTNSGAALTLAAGQSIELLPEFSLTANSTLEINLAGCE